MTRTTSEPRSSSSATTDTILEIRNTSAAFEMDRGMSRVLDHVHLDIHREEILGIVGESGSGKSMFASALLDAVVEPGQLSGDITYYPTPDEPIDILDLSKRELRHTRWEEIAMVFQGAMSSFNPTMSIRGHFVETLEAHNADFTTGMERAHQLLSDLYLNPERVLDSYPHELSGGMQQRALIALSLVLEPQVLVMDEPTAALDLLMQRSILRMLREIQEKYEITLIFITHDLPLVSKLADRMAVMYAFEFAEIGTTEEILRDAAHPYTRSLLNATPSTGMDPEQMVPIEGDSPDPVNTPAGCSYHPRCPLATDRCKTEAPEYRQITTSHQAACFHWEDAAESIPYNSSDAERTLSGPSSTRERLGDGERASSEDTVLSLEDVEVHFESSSSFFDLFGEPETVSAVDGVSLEIPENQVVALVGESGCGKTTLGKTAIGVQRPTGGSVTYRGQDIWDTKDGRSDGDIKHEEIRRSLQMIHQDPSSSLNPNRKVRKILASPLKKWQTDLNIEDRQARIYGMLETVGMTPPEDYIQRYPHQLSGGEKQRVALVRALLMNPDVILADEAISALDVSLRIEMMDLFLNLQDRFNTSFLFISHDISNAWYLTEKADGLIGIMYLGELVEIGPAQDILENPRHPYTQSLLWATPDLIPGDEGDELPLRKIDIPDPVNPPSGCRFHTRCPEAREACKRESPETVDIGTEHGAACFREYPETHAYWDSQPLTEGTDAEEAEPGDKL